MAGGAERSNRVPKGQIRRETDNDNDDKKNATNNDIMISKLMISKLKSFPKMGILPPPPFLVY